MPETWISYVDLAARLGISPEAARQRAIRRRWRRTTANDGKALVLVEIDDLPAPAQKRAPVERENERENERPDERAHERPDDARTVAALEAHVESLRAHLNAMDRLAAALRLDLDRERERGDGLDAELRQARAQTEQAAQEVLALVHKALEAAAARDAAQAELAAQRSRPWWSRLAAG